MGLLSNQDDVYKEGIYVICLTSVENLEPVGMQYVVKLDKIAVDNGLFSFFLFFFCFLPPFPPFPPWLQNRINFFPISKFVLLDIRYNNCFTRFEDRDKEGEENNKEKNVRRTAESYYRAEPKEQNILSSEKHARTHTQFLGKKIVTCACLETSFGFSPLSPFFCCCSYCVCSITTWTGRTKE